MVDTLCDADGLDCYLGSAQLPESLRDRLPLIALPKTQNVFRCAVGWALQQMNYLRYMKPWDTRLRFRQISLRSQLKCVRRSHLCRLGSRIGLRIAGSFARLWGDTGNFYQR